jgi:hypothetical protein
MPKRITSTDAEALAFGRRLTKLLADSGQPRRGAGAYLAKRYKVATVTANAWLNGEYKANTTTARQIAVDHGGTFDELYFGVPASVSRIDADHQSQLLRLDPVMLSEVHRVLRELSTDAGKSFDIERESDAVRFLQVLDLRTQMQAKPSKEEWTRYGMRLARIMATQGAASDGRGDSVPTQGTGKGRVAGGVRGKA